MNEPASECDELRLSIEQLRAMLEGLIVRGLRACGPDELAQLKSFIDYLERAGAGHVTAVLSQLHEQIERDDRASARTLLKAQTAIRLLERLLTLRVVRGEYEMAVQRLEHPNDVQAEDDGDDEGE